MAKDIKSLHKKHLKEIHKKYPNVKYIMIRNEHHEDIKEKRSGSKAKKPN
jgi:hypothetical protein